MQSARREKGVSTLLLSREDGYIWGRGGVQGGGVGGGGRGGNPVGGALEKRKRRAVLENE